MVVFLGSSSSPSPLTSSGCGCGLYVGGVRASTVRIWERWLTDALLLVVLTLPVIMSACSSSRRIPYFEDSGKNKCRDLALSGRRRNLTRIYAANTFRFSHRFSYCCGMKKMKPGAVPTLFIRPSAATQPYSHVDSTRSRKKLQQPKQHVNGTKVLTLGAGHYLYACDTCVRMRCTVIDGLVH